LKGAAQTVMKRTTQLL